MIKSQYLLYRIECLRREMTEVATNKGFTSSESIQLSQELDKLLNLYEKNKYLEEKK